MYQFKLKEIGRYCSDFRRARRMSQEEVANVTGYTQGNISSFERGDNASFMLLAWYIAQGLDVDGLRVILNGA